MVFSSNIFLFFFLPIFLIAYFVTPQNVDVLGTQTEQQAETDGTYL